jgi:hypothetical protein
VCAENEQQKNRKIRAPLRRKPNGVTLLRAKMRQAESLVCGTNGYPKRGDFVNERTI